MQLFDEANGTAQAWRFMKAGTFLNRCLPTLMVAALMITLSLPAQTSQPVAISTANSATNAAAKSSPPIVDPTTAQPNQPLSVVAPLPAQSPEPMAPGATNAAGTSGATRIMTIDECIKIALEHNLDIQIQKFNPQINQYLLGAIYGTYEPVFNFTGTKNYNDSPGGLNPQTGLPFGSNIREGDNYSPEVKGVLPTGLTYDFTGTLTRNSTGGTNNNGSVGYLPPFWTSDPGVTLSQPVLRNFWIDNTRLQIQLDKATLKISEAALRLQVMTTITAVKSAYYNLLYARGNVEANATAYKLAEQLVAENVKRVEVGALAPLDEKQSESQAAASLAAMQAAQQALLVQENTLKGLITDNYSQWAGVTLLPAEKLSAVAGSLNLQESWRKAVTKRPELVEAKLRVEAQNVQLKYNFNQLFPELDVTGSYGRNANENSFYDNLTDLRNEGHSFYSYGAFVSIPLGGNYAARANYKSSKSTLKQLLATLKQVEQNVIIAVDNDVGSVRSTLQQVYATRDARVYAEDALAAEQKKLENGKSTSFVVLQLINNLTTAKVAEIQALANYNIAVAQLSLDEGSTLDDNQVQLSVR